MFKCAPDNPRDQPGRIVGIAPAQEERIDRRLA
jgi:hypothetical protein